VPLCLMPRIDVLMSTFNGAAFLPPQIDSIIAQEHADWRLLIRDDGSSDATLNIIKAYAERDARIELLTGDSGNLGAFASFMRLVEASDAPYFAFCDQDDVWSPQKLSLLLEKMIRSETQYGADTPLVVFSDMSVVDENLVLLDASFRHFSQFDPFISRDWRRLLAQNVVLGCSMLANAAARRAALPYKLRDMPHDQWVAVNAARSGRIEFIDEATVSYRQHGRNYAGAKKFGLLYAISRLPHFIITIGEYRRAAAHFGDVTTLQLTASKFRTNVRRFDKKEAFRE